MFFPGTTFIGRRTFRCVVNHVVSLRRCLLHLFRLYVTMSFRIVEFCRRVDLLTFEGEIKTRRGVVKAWNGTRGIRFVLNHRRETSVRNGRFFTCATRNESERIRRRTSIRMVNTICVSQNGRCQRTAQDYCTFNSIPFVRVCRASIIRIDDYGGRESLRFFRFLKFRVTFRRVSRFSRFGRSSFKGRRFNRILGLIPNGMIGGFVQFVTINMRCPNRNSNTSSKGCVKLCIVFRWKLRNARVNGTFSRATTWNGAC